MVPTAGSHNVTLLKNIYFTDIDQVGRRIKISFHLSMLILDEIR